MSLSQKYKNELSKALETEFKIGNKMLIPEIEKVIINTGIGTYIRSGNKDFSNLQKDLELITGQKTVVKLAKKSVSNFKLREGMPVGMMVTLRGEKMYNFLNSLINVVLPRVRDFRGINKKSFDREGNYNFGIKEHTIFPEVPQTDVVRTQGLQVTIKFKTNVKEQNKRLLEMFSFPFTK